MHGCLGVPPNILLAHIIQRFFWTWHGVWPIYIIHKPETPL
jgi:hypothetical protein